MFQIDPTSRKSIYQQVVDNLKELIMKQVIKPNEKLPSVRELSKVLLINPNTVSKAYKELEREGYIYTTNGLGTFAAETVASNKNDDRINEIKSHLTFYINELHYNGADDAEIMQTVQEILKKRGDK